MEQKKYQSVALKIGKMDLFSDIHNCGAPTKTMPVNLYCETAKGKRFYVCCDMYERADMRWSVNWTNDPDERVRAKMNTAHFKNQTEALTFVKERILGIPA